MCVYAQAYHSSTCMCVCARQDTILPVLSYFNNVNFTSKQVAELQALYPESDFNTATERLSRMLIDSYGWIGHCTTRRALEYVAKHQSNAYLYHFARTGKIPVAGHFSEVAYVFQNCESCGIPEPQYCCQGNGLAKADVAIMSAMGQFWSSFAATGVPKVRGSKDLSTHSYITCTLIQSSTHAHVHIRPKDWNGPGSLPPTALPYALTTPSPQRPGTVRNSAPSGVSSPDHYDAPAYLQSAVTVECR